MGLKPCLGLPGHPCGKLSQDTRCPAHKQLTNQAREARRGTRQERGLDAEYDRNRIILLANVTVCAVCGEPGSPRDPLTAGHITPRNEGGDNDLSNLRAEHASYNYSQGKRPCSGTRL
jgi:5-methylcytosine-specific restriction endonuclease McrA